MLLFSQPPEQPRGMSGIQPEDGSPPYRNWTSGSELNETREALLTPSSDYDDEEFLRYLWKEYLHPKEYEWALIAGYIVVFIVALVGNVLGESSSPELPVLPPRDGFCTEGGWKPGWVWHTPLERRRSPAEGESSGCAEGAVKSAPLRGRGAAGGPLVPRTGRGVRNPPRRPGCPKPRLPAGSRPCPRAEVLNPPGTAAVRKDAAPSRSPAGAGDIEHRDTDRGAGSGTAPGPRREPALCTTRGSLPPSLPAGGGRAPSVPALGAERGCGAGARRPLPGAH